MPLSGPATSCCACRRPVLASFMPDAFSSSSCSRIRSLISRLAFTCLDCHATAPALDSSVTHGHAVHKKSSGCNK
eukprot:2144699-Rhodomonas_salina.1